MEISSSSIREFLQSIAHAASQKGTRDYDDLLRMVLEDHFLDPAELQRSGDNFPSEIFLGREDVKGILLSKLIWEEFGQPEDIEARRINAMQILPNPRRRLLKERAELGQEKDYISPLAYDILPSYSHAHVTSSVIRSMGRAGVEQGENYMLPNKRIIKSQEQAVEQGENHMKRITLLGWGSDRFLLPAEVEQGVSDSSEFEPVVSRVETSPFPSEQEAETPTQCYVIKIAGGSGIGKTSLARAVYEESSVKEHFDLCVWVQLEERELDLKNVARGILRSVMGMACAVDDLDELEEMVRDILQGQRCLIVFDGIGTVRNDSWMHMKRCWFDFLDLGSKVLITTPSEDVLCLPSHEIELSPLIMSNSQSLFSRIAFGKPQMRISAEHLVSGCGGIPLLLKLLGSLLRYDEKIADLLFSVKLLPSTWDESSIVLLCVWSLPPRLRQCLAYCALFPKGYALNKEKMIEMWSANGVLDLGDGDACFHHLLCRSFFTDLTRDQSNNVIEFRIPSLIHEILEDVARIIYREKLGSLGLISYVGEDAGRISLAGKYNSDHLRTLILSPTPYFGGSLDHSLVDFQELTSLDLSCSGIRDLSGDVGMLRELRYLNLSYTLVERLPDSITDLSLLQTMDLSWCYHLKCLPSRLRDLTLMSHLDLSKCETLSHFPSGINSLRSLSSMPLFVLGKARDSARLRELGPLDHLKGRLEIRNLENVQDVLEAQDTKLDEKRLQHLELSWNQSDDDGLCFQLLELLQPNQQLEVLGLRGYMGSEFPEWISSMKNLVKISITDSGCEKLPSLGQLPLLKELHLKGMTNLECIGPEFYGEGIADVVFQSLERLEVCDLPRLTSWLEDERAFLSLKFMTIEGCPKLRRPPRFPNLHDFIVSNSNTIITYYMPNCTSLLMNATQVWDLRCDHTFGALKKLILRNVPNDFIALLQLMPSKMFSTIEHLGVLHCNKLRTLYVNEFSSFKKLHVVDCQDLQRIVVDGEVSLLVELVVEDCPQARAEIYFHQLPSLRKLIVRNCSDQFNIYDTQYKMMKQLQFLSISECPGIEKELQDSPDLMSHIPVVIVGNRRAKNTMARENDISET